MDRTTYGNVPASEQGSGSPWRCTDAPKEAGCYAYRLALTATLAMTLVLLEPERMYDKPESLLLITSARPLYG